MFSEMKEEYQREAAFSLSYKVDRKRLRVGSVWPTRRREFDTGHKDETVSIVVVSKHTLESDKTSIRW